MLPTLQLAGVDIGAHSEARPFRRLGRALRLPRSDCIRPWLVMLGLFVAIVCVRAMLSTRAGSRDHRAV